MAHIWDQLALQIKDWGRELGFDQIGIADINLDHTKEHYLEWIKQGLHGEMHYMVKHGSRRYKPDELVPNTVRVITARINYLPRSKNAETVLHDDQKAFISRYALGRDYHKVLRSKLKKLSKKIQQEAHKTLDQSFKFRIFTDSAPVMEVELAEKSGLGWRGKHTLLINKEHGSWFFLGEIYINLPLPVDEKVDNHCGTCTNCIDICPTKAIIGPYKLDARKCISYLTIEHPSAIPVEYRKQIGNRVYGCDDCQLYCPWNKFGQMSKEEDFKVRHGLDDIELIECFLWTEAEFLKRMEGSAILRIGYEQWLRNIAVGLGNAKTSESIINALKDRHNEASPLLKEHITWALSQHNFHMN
ncbi:MAG: tRNA epoxyqueuosine(34) reductase QueG [Candidatus Methylopumilus sp.]|nr:tRNA epoxyqueuosine(34) reductase QueG [Candidatus Methylopumilus sp.]